MGVQKKKFVVSTFFIILVICFLRGVLLYTPYSKIIIKLRHMKYNRILLKLSGESLMGEQSYGISPAMLEQYAADIKQVVDQKVEVAIVIGGGNIFRGLSGASKGMDRVQGAVVHPSLFTHSTQAPDR